MSFQPARYLLQAGKPIRKTLNRLFARAHRAGFLMLPGKSVVIVDGHPAGDANGAASYEAPAAGQARVIRRRRRFELEHRDHPKGIVEIDADRVRYAGPNPLTTLEITLHLKQGPLLLLERVLAIVGLEPALIPSRLTDAERALLAAGPAESQPRSAPGSHLTLDSRWQDLGLAHLKALGVQLRHHEPIAWESLDPEGVHQMRVATRRLREALRTFAPVLPAAETAALAGELRRLTATLGEVRDLDVQLGRLAGYQATDPAPMTAALKRYRRHLRKRQRRAHRALVDALVQPRFADLDRNLQATITAALAEPPAADDPAIAQAGPAALRRQLRRVLRAGRRAVADRRPERLHRLRIEAKRLRYFLEYVEPVGGPQIVAGVAALSELQDILGEHQDACIARHNLSRFRQMARVSGRERKVLARLVAAEASGVRAARVQFRNHWPAFVRASTSLVLC